MNMVPNVSDFLFNIQTVYSEADKTTVPAVAEWPLMDNPMLVFGATCVYVLYSWWIGPWLMKDKQPYILREPMLIYNFLMLVLNFYILQQFIAGAYSAGYTYPCTPFNASRDPSHVQVAAAVWWYFFSKLIEFMDTVFFVLRKKDRQISFLHVYHHASMPIVWWACAKWVPGGQSVFGAGFNAFVHVIMYTYYALSSFGERYQKYLWWKRYLTQLQIVQFLYAMGLITYSLYVECRFVRTLYYVILFQVFSFLVLFANFYVQSYLKGKSVKSKAN